MKTLDSLRKRDLLASAKFDAAQVRAYAEDYFAQERFGEAFAFFRKAGEKEGVRRCKARAIELGDPELLWQIEHADRSEVTREDWLACGEKAEGMGKLRNALYVYERLGETARAEALRAQINPPTAPAGHG